MTSKKRQHIQWGLGQHVVNVFNRRLTNVGALLLKELPFFPSEELSSSQPSPTPPRMGQSLILIQRAWGYNHSSGYLRKWMGSACATQSSHRGPNRALTIEAPSMPATPLEETPSVPATLAYVSKDASEGSPSRPAGGVATRIETSDHSC